MWAGIESGKWKQLEPCWLISYSATEGSVRKKPTCSHHWHMRHHYTQRLAPTSNKLVFQSTHPFRSNCDLEPFISYNTFCISVALPWALWLSGLRGSTISMWASQGQCWHRTEALESEFPGEKPILLLTVWYWTSNFLSLGFPKMRCNNNHHVFILYYFLGT